MNHHYILSHPYQPPHDEETYSQSSLCLGIACLAQSFDDSSGIRSPSDQCSLCNKLFHSLLAVTLKITHGSISDDEGLVSPVCCLAHSTLHTNLSGNTCNHHVGDAKTLKKIVELSLIEGPLLGLKIRYSPGSGATMSTLLFPQLPLTNYGGNQAVPHECIYCPIDQTGRSCVIQECG